MCEFGFLLQKRNHLECIREDSDRKEYFDKQLEEVDIRISRIVI